MSDGIDVQYVGIGHPAGFDRLEGVVLESLIVRQVVREQDSGEKQQSETDHQGQFVFARHSVSIRAGLLQKEL